jgi:hypothetical protein
VEEVFIRPGGGSIGVPCSDTARYTAFADSLANLNRPLGTPTRFAISTWRQRARTQLATWMLENGDEWLLFLDDDQVFAPDLLEQLLSHDKDIVAALCMNRAEPYGPFCFEEEPVEGIYRPIDLRAHSGDELVRVAAVGTGAMLIRRHVFEGIPPEEWFPITESGEDMMFCQAARDRGFEIYCDLGARLGHMTTTVVWPATRPNGEWVVGFVISDETRLSREITEPFPPLTA